MNKAQIVVLALSIAAIAGCSSVAYKTDTQTATAEKTGWDRSPASEPRGPLADGTQMRVLKKMKLRPVSAAGAFGAYAAGGRILSADEVKDLNEKNSKNVSRYCVLFTENSTKPVSVSEGEVLKLTQVPGTLHWGPGHLYSAEGSSAIKAVGCYVISPTGRAEVNEQTFREQLSGVLEITN